MKEWMKFVLLAVVFLLFFFAPVSGPSVVAALSGGLALLQEYARLHVLTCLVPAFFIAGSIAVFVKKDAVLRLLGPSAKKIIAYPVATISGGILAVCSCTILPLFTGIYKRGAGIGPAAAFLFTGPAINVTAILLTGSVLGWDLAVGRLVAAVIISIIAGLFLAFVFREHDEKNSKGQFVTSLVGRNTLLSNAVASIFGAFMYFATLTEVPIIQKLMALGMGRGPALTLFLTGNALSLPSMMVLFKVMGRTQASVYILTIMVLSVFAGMLFGELL